MNIYSIFGPTIYSDSQNSDPSPNPMNFLSSLFSTEFNELFQRSQSNQRPTTQNNSTERTTTSTQTTPNIEEVIFYYNDLQPFTVPTGIPLNEMRNISTLENVEEETDEVCVICHQPITRNQMIRKLNSCSHQFHIHCIDEWLSSNRTCPTCRRDLIEDTSNTTDSSQRSTLPTYQFRYGRERTR